MVFRETLKSRSGMGLGLVVMIAILCIPAFFIFGVDWFAHRALPILFELFWLLLGLDVVLLLVAIIRPMRSFAGAVIVLTACVFGLTLWLFSVVVTQELWGTWAVVLGLILFGGAVMPFAVLAALFQARWT